ncbi:MAG: hypothetical protein QME75_01015 [Deltaproteobacteria bacterium]|nr:hypothetical protein [Deltaproteobacteria bacterium]
MRRKLVIGVALLVLTLALPGMGQAQTAALWDGSHWMELPQEAKIGYIKGVGNMADYEHAVSGKQVGLVTRALEDQWRTKSISTIVQEVDRFYQQNPQDRNMPVIEVVLRCCSGLKIPPAGASRR